MQPKDWKTNDKSFLSMLLEGIRSRGGTCLARTAVAAANAFTDKRSATSVCNDEDRKTLNRANKVLKAELKETGTKLRKVGQMWSVSVSDVVSPTKKSKKPLSAPVPETTAGVASSKTMPEGQLYDVYLTGNGINKLGIIRDIREITNMGLREAKTIADAAGTKAAIIVQRVDESRAMAVRDKIERTGGSTELRPVAA